MIGRTVGCVFGGTPSRSARRGCTKGFICWETALLDALGKSDISRPDLLLEIATGGGALGALKFCTCSTLFGTGFDTKSRVLPGGASDRTNGIDPEEVWVLCLVVGEGWMMCLVVGAIGDSPEGSFDSPLFSNVSHQASEHIVVDVEGVIGENCFSHIF